MKKILVTLFMILLLTGCRYQGGSRPEQNDNEVWVCENPRAEFYWNEKDDMTSVMYINGEMREVTAQQTVSPEFYVYDINVKNCEREDIEEDGSVHKYMDGEAMNQYLLLKCHANYKRDKFDLTVEEDLVNMFGGEKPTLHFEKRNKAEYLKEIGEEP